MAPIKFEENIREKLEARSLQPSADAWQNLEQKLNADSKKRNKNKFWWFGIAACVVGVLFVIQQMITFDKVNPSNTPIIVNKGNDILNKTIDSPIVEEKKQQIVQEKPETKANQKLVTASNKPKGENIKVNKKTLVKSSVITQNQVAQELPEEQLEPIENPKQNLATDLAVIDIKDSVIAIKTPIASVKSSDSEIEDLLAAANKEIELNENKAINSITVDANTLLKDAETEMPPSLRGQLFKVIEKNFKTAKSAVATRNE